MFINLIRTNILSTLKVTVFAPFTLKVCVCYSESFPNRRTYIWWVCGSVSIKETTTIRTQVWKRSNYIFKFYQLLHTQNVKTLGTTVGSNKGINKHALPTTITKSRTVRLSVRFSQVLRPRVANVTQTPSPKPNLSNVENAQKWTENHPHAHVQQTSAGVEEPTNRHFR